MTDWPLMIFIACCGALIMFIGLMNIVDLDSFFAALATVIEAVTALPDLLTDGINSLLQNVGPTDGASDSHEAPTVKGADAPLDEEGAMTEEVKPRP